jgi:hypothetical protein
MVSSLQGQPMMQDPVYILISFSAPVSFSLLNTDSVAGFRLLAAFDSPEILSSLEPQLAALALTRVRLVHLLNISD